MAMPLPEDIDRLSPSDLKDLVLTLLVILAHPNRPTLPRAIRAIARRDLALAPMLP
jgi:hypothetical protein